MMGPGGYKFHPRRNSQQLELGHILWYLRGRAPPGGFKFEVQVNGVIYGPPDVVSLHMRNISKPYFANLD